MTPDVIARANEAKIVIKQMITFLDMLVHDTDPSSDLGVDDRRGPFQEPNTRLGKHIVFLKQQIEAAKKLIELSKKLPLSNVDIKSDKKLIELFNKLPMWNVESDQKQVKADRSAQFKLGGDEKQIEAAKKQIEELLQPNFESDPSAQLSLLIVLLQQDEMLGKDLVKLDKLATRDYEKILDAALTLSNDYVPIFERIDRTQLEDSRKLLEAAFNPNKPSPIVIRFR